MVLFLKTSGISRKQVSISDWKLCIVRTPPWQMEGAGRFFKHPYRGALRFFQPKGGLSMLGGTPLS